MLATRQLTGAPLRKLFLCVVFTDVVVRQFTTDVAFDRITLCPAHQNHLRLRPFLARLIRTLSARVSCRFLLNQPPPWSFFTRASSWASDILSTLLKSFFRLLTKTSLSTPCSCASFAAAAQWAFSRASSRRFWCAARSRSSSFMASFPLWLASQLRKTNTGQSASEPYDIRRCSSLKLKV